MNDPNDSIPRLGDDALAYLADEGEERTKVRMRRVADSLREMADDIDRQAEKGEWGTMMHTIAWGVANLNLDMIASQAAETATYRGAATERGAVQFGQ